MAKLKRNSILSFNKKGNAILDTLFVIVILFVFVFGAMFGYKILLEMKDDILEDVDNPQAKAAFNEIESRYPSVLDGAVLLLFIGLWIMGVVASFMSDSHPVFFGISMFLLIFVLIVGMFMGNFYEELFSDPDLSDLPGYFPATNWLLTHMLLVGIIIGFSILIVLFAKSQT